MLLLVLGVLLLLRRPSRARNEVEHFFLASAAATRKEREISEIDAFARRASASAEDLKARVRKLRTGHFQQVKIYIDHSNFIRTWTQVVHSRDRPLEHDINWTTLPQVLMEATSEWLSKARKSPQALLYRGTNVYGTLFQEDYFKLLETMLRLEQTAPDKLPLPIRLRKETVERWREENEAHKVELTRAIQQEMGYLMVPIFRRTPREDQLLSSQLHGRRHPDRAGEDAGHPHRHRPDRRRHLRRLRHRPPRLGGQRLRAGRRFRAGDAQQAGGARGLRQPHERAAQQMPAPHRPRPRPAVPPRAEGPRSAETARTQRPGATRVRPAPGCQAAASLSRKAPARLR